MLNFLVAFFLKIFETLKAHVSGTETDVKKHIPYILGRGSTA